MPMFALRCPLLQIASFQEDDGDDPTLPLEEGSLLDGARLRRTLWSLRAEGSLTAWALCLSGGSYYLHLLCTQGQATSWYQWQDWVLSTLKPETAKAQHVFLL